MNNPTKQTNIPGNQIIAHTYSTALTEESENLLAVKAILEESVSYFNLSSFNKGNTPHDRAINNGLMIASITIFFSCFDRTEKRYSLSRSTYNKNHSMMAIFEKFKKIRDERIAHRAQRKAIQKIMRPTDPAMVSISPVISYTDSSHVKFSITPEEVREFRELLRFTTSVVDEQENALQSDILKERIDAGPNMPLPNPRTGKRKNKATKRKRK